MTARRAPGPARASAGQRQAVYLTPERKVRVVAEDESLAVLEGPVLIARIPLARADRVLCNDRVDWSGKAVTACLRHGVNITWLDPQGNGLGDCNARNQRIPEVHEFMLRYLDKPDWAERLDDWLRRRRFEILLRVADARARRDAPMADSEVECLKRSYVYRDEAPTAAAGFAGWFESFVSARLGRIGLGANYRGYGGAVLPLAQLLARLLCAEFELATGDLVPAGTTGAIAPRFFEAWSSEANRRLADHIGSFCAHIAREADTWH